MKISYHQNWIVLAMAFLCFSSCEKANLVADQLECKPELSKMHITAESLHATINSQKTIMLGLVYTGDIRITNVKWFYGNGETSSGSKTSTTMLFVLPGVYKVKARVTLSKHDQSCSVDVEKDVRVD